MSVIDEYFKKFNPAQQAELKRIRQIVRETVPEAEEAVSYGVPAFKYKEKYLIGYCAYKDHLSLFPGSEPIEAVKDKLKDFTLSKGTIQFTLEHSIPESVIKEMLHVRIADIEKK
jgi:uncharacterized protein YdhG (YjbR/CyaY superfamily)